jgi:hypothetical protein
VIGAAGNELDHKQTTSGDELDHQQAEILSTGLAENMKEPLVPCYFDKVPFPTEAMAQREADLVNRSQSRRRKVCAFQCQNCGAWHVGGQDSAPVHYLVRQASQHQR